MKMHSIKYLLKEGVLNAWANRLMSLASVGVLVACMVVIGLAILISENVNLVMGRLEQQNVVMVYMDDYAWALYGEGSDDKTDSKDTSSASSNVSSENTSSKTDDTSSDTDTTSSDTDSTSSKTNEDNSEDQTEEEEEIKDADSISPNDYVIHNEQEAKELCKKIEKISNVKSAKYIKRDDALEQLRQNFLKDQAGFFNFLDEEYGNPLPDAAEVTMLDMAQFDQTLEEIKKLDGVAYVRAQDDIADKILTIKNGIGIAGICIISILIIIALVIVSNTIRVTMYNRKLEISIMKAVGATDAFVRIPFVAEGMLIGIISALVSEGLLYFCYRIASEAIASELQTTELIAYGDVAWYLLLVFVAIGIFAGALGSIIIIGKYLRKEGSEFAAI